MASLNKVILIGNVGSDPEVRYFDGGGVVARFSVATNDRYTNRSGETVEQTEWFRVEVWNEQAKTIEKYLRKGSQIYVEGRLRTETFTDKEGKERFSLGVRATSFQFLGGPNDRPEGGNGSYEAPRQQQPERAPAAPQLAPTPQPAVATSAAPRQQPSAAPRQQPAPRREPDPVPFEGNSGDDDLPF